MTYLSDEEDDGDFCHLSLEEMDISKKEGELETSNNCLKIEQAVKTLDKKFKGSNWLRVKATENKRIQFEKKESGALRLTKML